MRTISKLNKTL